MQVLVLADTHLRFGLDTLPPPVLRRIETADVVLHAGDVTSLAAYSELARRSEVHAVLGNNDTELRHVLPERAEVELAGVRVGLVHDSGARDGRADRLAGLFPTADVVVFGHSHVPWNEPGRGGQLLFNPGSPTQRRHQPVATFGLLHLEAGAVLRHEIVPVA